MFGKQYEFWNICAQELCYLELREEKLEVGVKFDKLADCQWVEVMERNASINLESKVSIRINQIDTPIPSYQCIKKLFQSYLCLSNSAHLLFGFVIISDSWGYK